MKLSRISTEKFDDAVKSMTDAGFLKATVEQALKKLIIAYDENWEHIEADNYSLLVEALVDLSDPKAGQKKRAEKNLNMDSDNHKKLKTKERGQKPKYSMHGSVKTEFAEVPHQQEADSLEERTTGGTGRAETTRIGEKSPTLLGSQDPCTSETPASLTVMCPVSRHNGIKRQRHDVNDITRGEECVSIPIVGGKVEVLPPSFHYMSQNTTFQNAYVNLSLARIGDENCCSSCFGDCLANPLPCACTRETGGEFAYTLDGLLKKGFLDACISMLREPHEQPLTYCKGVCPEQMKKGVNSAKPDACKGHPIKKFIKECWRKCGCNRNCGNCVVQRGITRKLQVFLTPGKKGWGLRSAERLPRGAFVCEYVGEILTNTELYERNTELYEKNNKKNGKTRHTYPVLLDNDWGTERVLKDEEALCLDGTFYGNVARFINHRCHDGNIIDIPVEIETPDHHYYHVAFFTMREVEPLEELTWDYGIDFDDVDHPIKAFKCHCGSKFCRDKRRISGGSKSRALVLS